MDRGAGGAQTYGGRYRVVAPLAHGGMSEVVQALDERLHRPVALKLLAPAIAQDASAKARFEQEARAVASLGHPGIVTVYDHGTDGVPYIVMELVDGPTLKAEIDRRAPMAEEEATAIALQMLDALGHAHERGIVHRDVKPQNVLLGPDGTVKLADFGIARSVAATAGLTQAGQIVGTAAYLSPEQAAGGLAGPESDIYAVGVVMYELLTGTLPFDGDNAVAIARRHVDEPPPPLRSRRPGVSPALEAVVARAMQKRPEDRFADAAAMAAALRGVQEPSAAATTAPMTVHEQGGRSRRLGLAALAVLALMTAVVALAWPGSDGDPAAGAGDSSASSQPAKIRVPDVIGLQFGQAETRLSRAGLVAIRKIGGYSSTPKDGVLSAQPATGTALAAGTKVTLVVSSGPAPAPAPKQQPEPKPKPDHKHDGGKDHKHDHGKDGGGG
jgi:hypothetical protein